MPFRNSGVYWRRRFKNSKSRGSGDGSRGRLARFKADFLNRFVQEHGLTTVIEFGCGDGDQLVHMEYPVYCGFDISKDALHWAQERTGRRTWTFAHLAEYDGQRAELALSLDVVYHLVEDKVYRRHMRLLFDAAEKYVIVYSSNTEAQQDPQSPHVRHRRFTDWAEKHAPAWTLTRVQYNLYPGGGRNQSLSDFYVYEKVTA